MRAKRSWVPCLSASTSSGHLPAAHHERGCTKQDVLVLCQLIDWLLVLPDEMTFESRRELRLFEMEQARPYIVKPSREAGRE